MSIIPSQSQQGAIEQPQQSYTMDLDRCIIEWLDEKRKHGDSKKTEVAYTTEIYGFRVALQRVGLDLDGEPATVAPLARRWCDRSMRVNGAGQAHEIAPKTFNQRRSILSSFYEYAI